MNYILDGKRAVPCDDIFQWAQWFETTDRIVKQVSVNGAKVSTVFLGLDHNFSRSGPPLVFETMVFGGPMDQEQQRYSTWEEAEAGHDEMVARMVP